MVALKGNNWVDIIWPTVYNFSLTVSLNRRTGLQFAMMVIFHWALKKQEQETHKVGGSSEKDRKSGRD